MEIEQLFKYAGIIAAIIFAIPWIIGHLLVFSTALYLQYYHNSRLQPGEKTKFEFWQDARRKVANFWLGFARAWYNYEIVGLENLPKEPSLLIAFHGAMPVDGYFFMHSVFLKTQRQLSAVTDRFIEKFPAFRYYSECFQMSAANLEQCIQIIKRGETLFILPGGAYEGHMSQNYELKWRNRVGFAKVAIAAKVKIVPIFTTNIQEAYRTIGIFMGFWEWFYEKTRLPLVPMYGGFPVKLTTYVGKPIVIEDGMTPEEVKKTVMDEIEMMIRMHQTKPGSILMAIKDRFF
ncbi:TMEM68.2 family protein [Megaselia abdita]